MIRHGDRIAVGVSGGKDSLCLLWALAKLKEFFPEKYHLEAVTINLGLGDPGWKRLRILQLAWSKAYHRRDPYRAHCF